MCAKNGAVALPVPDQYQFYGWHCGKKNGPLSFSSFRRARPLSSAAAAARVYHNFHRLCDLRHTNTAIAPVCANNKVVPLPVPSCLKILIGIFSLLITGAAADAAVNDVLTYFVIASQVGVVPWPCLKIVRKFACRVDNMFLKMEILWSVVK